MYIFVPLALLGAAAILLAWLLEAVGGVSIDLNAWLGAAALVIGALAVGVAALFGGEGDVHEPGP